MSVLPIRRKAKRQSSRIRKGPHARTHLLWQVLVGTLVLDPLIPRLIPPPPLPAELAAQLAVICALMVLPFLAQGFIHSVLSRLRTIHTKNIEANAKFIPIALSTGVFLVAALKLTAILNLPLVLRLLLVAIVAHGIITSTRKLNKQNEEATTLFKTNPWAKLQQWEQQLIVFTVIPLALARAISLCGAFAQPTPTSPYAHVMYLGVSALFLLMLRPDRSLFVGSCTTCKHPVPIAFQELGSCLDCDPRLRHAYHAWVNKLPYPPAPPEHSDEQRAEQHKGASKASQNNKKQQDVGASSGKKQNVRDEEGKIRSKRNSLPLKPG